jgi:hypothetical protein
MFQKLMSKHKINWKSEFREFLWIALLVGLSPGYCPLSCNWLHLIFSLFCVWTASFETCVDHSGDQSSILKFTLAPVYLSKKIKIELKHEVNIPATSSIIEGWFLWKTIFVFFKSNRYVQVNRFYWKECTNLMLEFFLATFLLDWNDQTQRSQKIKIILSINPDLTWWIILGNWERHVYDDVTHLR